MVLSFSISNPPKLHQLTDIYCPKYYLRKQQTTSDNHQDGSSSTASSPSSHHFIQPVSSDLDPPITTTCSCLLVAPPISSSYAFPGNHSNPLSNVPTVVQTAQDRNRAIEEAISQLRDDSATHTTSIDSIRSDISTLQNSMTTLTQMIQDLSRKLGVQITLPPLLLSLASPTAPTTSSATVVGSTSSAPPLPEFQAPPLTPAVAVTAAPPSPKSSTLPTISPPAANSTTPPFPSSRVRSDSHTSTLIPSKTAILKTATNTPTITPSTISGITGIESFLDNSVAKARSKIASLIQSYMFSLGVMLLEVLYVQPALKSSLCKEQEWTNAHNMFVEMYKLKHGSKVFIFDPGGTFNIEGISDLEDKVVFEGSVMIRYHCIYTPKRTLHRPARYLGTQQQMHKKQKSIFQETR